MVSKTSYTSFLLLIFIITTATISTTHSQQCERVASQVDITSPIHKAMVVTRAISGERDRKILAIKKKKFKVNDDAEEKIKNSDASDGFVAVNADYHSPRHHPPRNN